MLYVELKTCEQYVLERESGGYTFVKINQCLANLVYNNYCCMLLPNH